MARRSALSIEAFYDRGPNADETAVAVLSRRGQRRGSGSRCRLVERGVRRARRIHHRTSAATRPCSPITRTWQSARTASPICVPLMSLAADDAGLPADPGVPLALMAYLEWGTRLAVLNSQPGATTSSSASCTSLGLGRGTSLRSRLNGSRRHQPPFLGATPLVAYGFERATTIGSDPVVACTTRSSVHAEAPRRQLPVEGAGSRVISRALCSTGRSPMSPASDTTRSYPLSCGRRNRPHT